MWPPRTVLGKLTGMEEQESIWTKRRFKLNQSKAGNRETGLEGQSCGSPPSRACHMACPSLRTSAFPLLGL